MRLGGLGNPSRARGNPKMTEREKLFFLHGMAFGSLNKADAKLGNRVGQAMGLTNEVLLDGASDAVEREIHRILKDVLEGSIL
jgi:hypothetical protein